jgi:hypothetical protein
MSAIYAMASTHTGRIAQLNPLVFLKMPQGIQRGCDISNTLAGFFFIIHNFIDTDHQNDFTRTEYHGGDPIPHAIEIHYFPIQGNGV